MNANRVWKNLVSAERFGNATKPHNINGKKSVQFAYLHYRTIGITRFGLNSWFKLLPNFLGKSVFAECHCYVVKVTQSVSESGALYSAIAWIYKGAELPPAIHCIIVVVNGVADTTLTPLANTSAVFPFHLIANFTISVVVLYTPLLTPDIYFNNENLVEVVELNLITN